ncbi:taurine transport system permease protein/sulfonate transport system permease protein [Sphaerochaeta associata]|jgi:ABC-type nitrate/sulfonate/bicarbonate transport system permease component|nr:taurine transport system permease protein/sulfonate transport system permease protein [Sphaerochaeta associata]
MEKIMSKINTSNLSQAEIRERRLEILYKILPVISILLLAGLWLLASRDFNAAVGSGFPTPTAVWDRTIRLFTRPVKKMNLIMHALVSLRRIGIALAFDWTFGIMFGILIGWFPKPRAFFSPLFDAFRAVPPLAWIPLITLWFGIGEFPKILIVIFGSLASIVVNVKAGLSAVDSMYLNVGTVFNATPTQTLLKIAIPSSLDAIFAGVRTSTSAAWMVVLAAEMLGADSGVGFLISRGMDSIDMPLVLTGMIAIGIVGAILAIVTQFIERLICPWTRKSK